MIKTFEFKVELEPIELAELFWDMNENEMAEFFNSLERISAEPSRIAYQFQIVGESSHLSPGGRKVMQLIGAYGNESRK